MYQMCAGARRTFRFSHRGQLEQSARCGCQNYTMARLKITLIIILATLLNITSRPTNAVAVDADWDASPADRIDHYPVGPFAWPRFDASAAFARRTVQSDTGHRLGPNSKLAVVDADDDEANLESPSIKRQRRDTDGTKMEQINAAKNVREARMMGSPESWSKQPLPVQFRQRESLEEAARDDFDDRNDSSEVANLPPLIRAHYAPKTDFVTSGKSRGPEGRYFPPEGRESREMPVSRSYEDYDVPVFRNIVREHDFDVQLPRNYYYPNRYRSQRDYYPYRANPYDAYYDRYRDDENMDYDMYSRYRPTPKPKRIIYYATLPEIVRKPNDLRNYPTQPYDRPLVRPEAQIEADRIRVGPNTIEPSRRPLPLPYPYDNYDSYVKRSSYYDRRRPSYFAAGPEDRERARASFRDKMRSDDGKLEKQAARSDDRRPWPLQIGAELNVKEHERIPGRKIFGQIDGYERYESSRIRKTSGNTDKKEGGGEQDNNIEKRNNSTNIN